MLGVLKAIRRCPERRNQGVHQRCCFCLLGHYEWQKLWPKYFANQADRDKHFPRCLREKFPIAHSFELLLTALLPHKGFYSRDGVAGQHAGGDVNCLRRGLKWMQAMRHRPPALCMPAGNGRVMNAPTRLGQCFGYTPCAWTRLGKLAQMSFASAGVTRFGILMSSSPASCDAVQRGLFCIGSSVVSVAPSCSASLGRRIWRRMDNGQSHQILRLSAETDAS